MSKQRPGIDETGTTVGADALDETHIAEVATSGLASTWRPLAFDERYVLGSELGAGGMGEVFLARDRVVGRDVAIKRLRSGLDNPEVRRALTLRFLREARVQGRIEHPAVVPIHDVGLDADGHPFLAMKRIEGETMAAVLERIEAGDLGARERWPRRRLLSDLVHVCRALELAHRRGIVHRDVKPSNIMLGELGEVYLLDWGVARFGDADEPDVRDIEVQVGTAYGAIVGTIGYMAPEQRRGEIVDARADVYAVGCVLREILTIDEDVPELDAICVGACPEDPADRFASAGAMGDAIERYLDGDRDVAHRRELAHKHADAAEAVIATDKSADARASAMREAGRALALDPTCERAAAVASRLLLEPPDVTPPEVEAELRESSYAQLRTEARGTAINYAVFLGLVPLFFVLGARSAVFPAVIGGCLLAGALYASWLARRRSISQRALLVALFLDVLMVALVSRVLGVFILAPVVATGITLLNVRDMPVGRTWIVAPLVLAGLFLPLALELTSVLPLSYTFENGGLAVASSVVRLDTVPILASLAIFHTVNVVMVAFLSAAVRRNTATMERQLRLQAWQLAQLAPR